MSKKKSPPGYPGDEAIRKKFGEVVRDLRLQKGVTIEDADALIEEGYGRRSGPQEIGAISTPDAPADAHLVASLVFPGYSGDDSTRISARST